MEPEQILSFVNNRIPISEDDIAKICEIAKGFRDGYIIPGYEALEEFCQSNGFLFIIRAHQVAQNGHYWSFVANDIQDNIPTASESTLPSRCLTTWGAPNYCGMGNIATVTTIDDDHNIIFNNFDHVETPQNLIPDSVNHYFG